MREEERQDVRQDVSVVVLAGGRSSRFGGDKLAASLDGTTVLDRLLSALPPTWPVVLVGPERPTARAALRWVREDPPGGGPLAGVMAGVGVVRTDLVAVLAGDMPYAAAAVPAVLEGLRAAGPDVDAAVGLDDTGHANPLLAAYRVAALRALLPGSAHDVPAKRLLSLAHVEVPVRGVAGRDVDTREDLARLGDD